MRTPDLIYLYQCGIFGYNYYWHNRERLGYSEEELRGVGIADDLVQVYPGIIVPLLGVERDLKRHGYRLLIKEGYRSEALYELIYQRYVAKHGQLTADRLFNMEDKPHADGRSVDTVLWDIRNDREVYLRGNDGPEALFVDFYEGKTDERSQTYHFRQQLLISIMQDHGFRLGKKLEYWHFDYRPNEPRNYPL